MGLTIRQQARRCKGQGFEVHARRVEVLVYTSTCVHPIKPPDYVTIDHIDYRLCHRLVDTFKGIYPLLHQDLGHR